NNDEPDRVKLPEPKGGERKNSRFADHADEPRDSDKPFAAAELGDIDADEAIVCPVADCNEHHEKQKQHEPFIADEFFYIGKPHWISVGFDILNGKGDEKKRRSQNDVRPYNKFDAEPCKQFADDERRKCKAYRTPRPDCAEGDAKLVRSSLCEAIAKRADRGRKEVKKS